MTEKKIVGQVDENRIIHMNLTDDNGEDMPEYIQESEEIEDTYVNIQKTEEQKEDFTVLQNGENHNSRIVKITNQEFPKSSFSNGEDDKLGDVSIPDLEILTLYRPNKEDCSSKIQVVAGKQGAESQNQNSENHNSRIMKITNQDFSKSQIKNGENHNSGMMKTTIQESPESQFKNDENHTSGMVGITIQEFPKSQSNDTDINKTDLSDTEFSETEYSKTDFNDTESSVSAINPNPIQSNLSISGTEPDVMGEMDAYRDIIREHISYECFQDGRYHRREDVDELVELMVEVMMLPDNGTVRVAGVEKPAALVKNRFMKLNHEHIEYILTCLGANTTKVGNIKAYLLTTLYNAPMTISNYYTAEVNHDLYGSG